MNPLHYGCKDGSYGKLELLLKHYNKNINTKCMSRAPPICFYNMKNKDDKDIIDVIELFIKHGCVITKSGACFIKKLAQNDRINIIEYLLHTDPRVIEFITYHSNLAECTYHDNTHAYYARNMYTAKIVELFVTYAADRYDLLSVRKPHVTTLINMYTSLPIHPNGNTPLDEAINE
jgi:hypothetical protein